MKKLKITNIENNKYQLKDENNKIYSIGLEFYDVENPMIGSDIFMNSKLLDEKYNGYSHFYAFGPLNGIYGKTIINVEDEDVDIVILNSKEKKIYLKRYYG